MQRFSFDFLTRKSKSALIEKTNLFRKRMLADQVTAEERAKSKDSQHQLNMLKPVSHSGPAYIATASGMVSRPVRRRIMRMKAFARITNLVPGESRRIRRSMAFDSVRNKVAA